jgi:hypothetical protein
MDDMTWPGKCPKFDHCDVNRCPLDPLMERRTDHELDRAHTCRAPLRVRLEIAREALAAGGRIVHVGLSDAETETGRPLAELLAESDARAEALRVKGRRLAERFPKRRASVAPQNIPPTTRFPFALTSLRRGIESPKGRKAHA